MGRIEQEEETVKRSGQLSVLLFVVVVAAAVIGAGLVVSAQEKAKPKKRGRCDPMQQEQTDLSGTYSGKVSYPDADMNGQGTLTITGNTFTLTSGDKTQTGRITAATTCNYIAVSMMFGDVTPPKPGEAAAPPPPTISLRGRKMGARLSLMTVPGEKRRFSFGGGAASVRRHKAAKPKEAKPKEAKPEAAKPEAAKPKAKPKAKGKAKPKAAATATP